ncbi:MAG: PEP/pyruvate-binding domain-containing protein [Legionellaceae bacterium]|nr:PEP/pyruvate-binding domain-containing protein [Legionellaceae bacterium]
MQAKQELAETIGNKAANLLLLESMLKDYAERLGQLKTLTVTVPQICPLTHNDISRHLTTYAPGWIDLWHQFKTVQGSESSSLTTDAVEILNQLRLLIKETFSQHPYTFGEWDDFRQSIAPDSLLMIRSTGKEDAVDIANPGGNESVASVHQDPRSISHAIGTVVASYFSDKSLLQRLSGKQDILEDAFMPVLIQKMIGEVVSDVETPVVSGVMYTSPAGIQVQMAPGHGEYIVNSKGPCDTVYVSREHVVHVEINEKKQRLVPAESGLAWQTNSTDLANNLSIDRRVAAEIATIGRCIQDYYETPMDVEFVYDPALHSFCLVQARPIPPSSFKLIPPSSIAPNQVMFVKEHGDIIKAQVITPAGNAVQVIAEPEEILITDRIADALETYLHTQDNSLKVVVILEKAPQTSHEAAQFNSMGIPVLQVSAVQLKNLEASIRNQASVLIIDPQRKLIIDWTKNIKNHTKASEEIYAAGIIEEGLFQSSLSIYESLLPVFKAHPINIKSVADELSSSIGDLIERANSDDPNTSEQAFNALMQRLFQDLTKRLDEPVSLYESFEQLKANKSSDALKKIISQLYHLARNTNETIEMQTLYKLIFQHAVIDAAEIASAIHHPSITQQEWLDTVARLELLVTAPFNSALQTSSIHQLLETHLTHGTP